MMEENKKTEKMKGVEEQTRIRQYPVDHKGPYVVNIRAANVPLESKNIQKYIFNQYKHVEKIEQVNVHKMRVTFAQKEINKESTSQSLKSAREEANELPKASVWNKKYRIYISEKYVEVKGIIAWPVNEEINDFVLCEGKFNNSVIKPAKIVEAVRLKRKVIEGNEEKLENTSAVIVSFEGVILPNKINMDGLLIPVREFKGKQMFCNKCKRYNHTEKYCNNKEVKLPENIKCLQCKSDEHESGDAKCPKRKLIEKKTFQHEQQVRKKTIAELLRELDPNATMPYENLNLNEKSFPILPGTSRKRQAELRNTEKEKYADVLKSPEKKKKKNDENSSKSPPPGFINPNNENNELTQPIVDFMKSIINDMDIPPFMKNIIEIFVYPFINKIVNGLINSVTTKMNITSQWPQQTTA